MKHIQMLRGLCVRVAIAATLLAVAASAAAAAPALRVSAAIPDYVTPNRLMDTYVSVLNTDVSGIEAGMQIRFRTITSVAPDATGGLGAIEVSGGGTSDVVTYPFTIAIGPPGPFAIKAFDIGLTDGPVVPAMRAGSDPAELTTVVKLLSQAKSNFDVSSPSVVVDSPTESFRDTIVHVPVGLVGNPTATPARCAPSQLTTPALGTAIPQCPPESQIGLFTTASS